VHDASCIARGKSIKLPCKACPKGLTEEEEIQLTLDIQPGNRSYPADIQIMHHKDYSFFISFLQLYLRDVVCFAVAVAYVNDR
jgi:hypothetical protein